MPNELKVSFTAAYIQSCATQYQAYAIEEGLQEIAKEIGEIGDAYKDANNVGPMRTRPSSLETIAIAMKDLSNAVSEIASKNFKH